MTITLNSKSLDEALALGQRIAPSGGQLPVLSCCHFNSIGGGLRLSFDSVNSRLEVRLDTLGKESTGEFLAPIRHLRASLHADETTISFKDGWTHVKSGGTSRLGSLPADEFPKPRHQIPRHSVDAIEFLQALRIGSACCGESNSTPPWKTVVHYDASKARFVAGNGNAFAYSPCALLSESTLNLPMEAAAEILSIFSDEDDLKIGMEGSDFTVCSDRASYWCKGSSCGFPGSYEIAFQGEGESVTIERELFISALKSLSGFLDGFAKVSITPQEGVWQLSASSEGGNTSEVPVNAAGSVSGESFIIQGPRLARLLSPWLCDSITAIKTKDTLLLKPSVGAQMGVVTLMRNL